MNTLKKIGLFLAKQAGYITALFVLLIGGMGLGVLFAAQDSHPIDAVITTQFIMTPLAFIAGVLLSKLFSRKK